MTFEKTKLARKLPFLSIHKQRHTTRVEGGSQYGDCRHNYIVGCWDVIQLGGLVTEGPA